MLKDYGIAVRAERVSRGITLQYLAEAIGISVSYLSRIERGLVEPNFLVINKLNMELFNDTSGITDNTG